MKHLISDSFFNLPEVSMTKLNKIRAKVLKIYSENGDSQQSVIGIKRFCNLMAKQLVTNEFNFCQTSPYYQHRSFKLADENNIELALHIMPKGAEIPMHAHPDKFSLLFVLQGCLSIEYQNRFSSAIQKNHNVTEFVNSGNSSVGLPIFNNLHQIKSLSDYSVFLSLRLTNTASNNRIKRHSKKRVLSSLIYTVMFSFITANTAAFANGNKPINNDVPLKSQLLKPLNNTSAAKFRQSKSYDDRYDAVAWYKESAKQGDAESQYWLGVMYLDGSGINEDEDEALHWVSLAAGQGHKAADKLYNYLLENESGLDC